MTRQLLWGGLMVRRCHVLSVWLDKCGIDLVSHVVQDFGNFILPVLTWGSLRIGSVLQRCSPTGGDGSSQCCLCGFSPPQTPYITSCKHVYCFYCLQTAVAMKDDYTYVSATDSGHATLCAVVLMFEITWFFGQVCGLRGDFSVVPATAGMNASYLKTSYWYAMCARTWWKESVFVKLWKWSKCAKHTRRHR